MVANSFLRVFLVDDSSDGRGNAILNHAVGILAGDRDGVCTRRCSVGESRDVDRRALGGRSIRVTRRYRKSILRRSRQACHVVRGGRGRSDRRSVLIHGVAGHAASRSRGGSRPVQACS